jgi:glutamyl-Q tRNA(Asp) synthetase
MKEKFDKTSISPIGRFAPSPTGPLHFGTLIAALGSYLAAKQSGGKWLMRVEDLDLPRVVAGSADSILQLLDLLGFEWDGPILYQSQRFERYQEILNSLRYEGFLFDCSCSRREVLASAPHPGEEGPIYPGTCRNGLCGTRSQYAVRLRVDDQPVTFTDQVFGDQTQNLEAQVGDFILHRSDGVFAYQLAVVVDDIDTGVTQVVRGADLLSSTARQIYLYQCLQSTVPEYLHLPLAFGDNGQKLSKRNGPNVIINQDNGACMIWQGLDFLGQIPPAELCGCSSAELLIWGIENFQINKIPTSSRFVPLT